MKQSPKSDEWNLRHVVGVLRKRWRILAVAAFAGVLFAVSFQLAYPRKYESKAQLLVMRKDPRLAAKGVELRAESEVKVTEEILATHMQMIQSRNVVDGALKDNDMSELPSIVNNLGERQKPGDFVIENMTVSRGGVGQGRTAHVLNVSYRSRSESDSELVLRAIIKKYQSFLSAKFQDVNQEAASLISEAQTRLAEELKEAEGVYEQFRQQSSNLMWNAGRTGGETTNIHRVRYDGILNEIASLRLARAEAAARLDAVTERVEGRDLEELSDLEKLSLVDEKNLTRVSLLLMAQKGETESPGFQADQQSRFAHARVEYDSIASMQMREKALLIELGAQHPDVIGIQKQIESVQGFLDKQKQELKSGRGNVSLDPAMLFTAFQQLLKNDILAMDRRESRLNALAEETLDLASNMVTDEIQGESLRRDVQRKQELFDAAVDRLRDINLATDYGGFINEVLSEPELGLKIMPRLSISLPLGMLVFLTIGVFGVGVAEFRDRRFRTIDDLRNALHTDVLGQIPLVKVESGKRGTIFNRRQTVDSPRSPLLLKPDSRGADAFRLLRASLVFAEGDDLRQILCITSPNPADGKSTLTGNLAISLGQLGRRVLVIDCDLRRPAQHELFQLSNERGLTTLLSGNLDPDDVIQTTSYKNVFVMPRGESVSDPGEFLALGEFSRLLDLLRGQYDQILLDCPPILPVVDALAPASMADGVILVIRLERTSRLDAQAACSSLRQSGAEIDGVVINGLAPGTLDDGYYGYGNEYEYSRYRNASERPTIPQEFPNGSGDRLREIKTSAFHRNGNANSTSH